jgi:hypothetical protein
MPAPNVYQGQTAEQVFGDVPQDQRQSQMKLFYATDREPRDNEDGSFGYGSGRSASLAFGTALVEIDGNPSWEEFTALSLDSNRKKELEVHMGEITETNRLPPTPHPASYIDGKIVFSPERTSEAREIEARMNARKWLFIFMVTTTVLPMPPWTWLKYGIFSGASICRCSTHGRRAMRVLEVCAVTTMIANPVSSPFIISSSF